MSDDKTSDHAQSDHAPVPKVITTDVLVLGSGVIQLAVALECLSVGLSVTVINDSDINDSDINDSDIKDSNIDAAKQIKNFRQETILDPKGSLAALIESVAAPLREGDQPAATVEKSPPAGIYLRHKDSWHESDQAGVFGIPSSPLSTAVSGILGNASAFKAYLDRIKPVLTIGKVLDVNNLISRRIGKNALNVLVEPVVTYKYGVSSSSVEVAAMMPGFNETITRTGSLTGAALAYSDRYKQIASSVAPSTGWPEFYDLMLKKVTLLGGKIVDAGGSLPVVGEAEGVRFVDGVWLAATSETSITSRSLVTAQPRSDGNKRAFCSAQVTLESASEQEIKANNLYLTSWIDENGAMLSATVFLNGTVTNGTVTKQNGQIMLELRGATSDDPAPITDAQLEQALQKTGTKLAAEIAAGSASDSDALRGIIDSEPASEALLHELDEVPEFDEDMLHITCVQDTSDSGLSRAIRTSNLQAITLRRALLGLSTS